PSPSERFCPGMGACSCRSRSSPWPGLTWRWPSRRASLRKKISARSAPCWAADPRSKIPKRGSEARRTAANARLAEPVALNEGAHRLAGGVKSRVRRLKRAPDGLRDFDHRQLFELVEDEDRTLLVVEPAEQRFELGARAPRLGRVLGVDRRLALALFEVAVLLRLLAPDARRAAVRRDGAHADAVQPGAERSAAVVLVEFAVDDEEDLLKEIVTVRPRNAETTKDPQHERRVNFEAGAKIVGATRSRAESGLFQPPHGSTREEAVFNSWGLPHVPQRGFDS